MPRVATARFSASFHRQPRTGSEGHLDTAVRFNQRNGRLRFQLPLNAETTVFVRPYVTFVSLVFAPSQPEWANANSSDTTLQSLS
jgi:hypothetical protein